MKRFIRLLLAYWYTRHLNFATRSALEAYQARKLSAFLRKLSKRSKYFAPFKNLPLSQWPAMDKEIMMANFDTMNIAGLTLTQVMAAALAAERSRDFSPTVDDITVGLSSGTSAQRGVFVVSEKEKNKWAGIMLAKALPDGLFSGERVALFLRANSNLYTAVQTRWLTFEFFDLFEPFDRQTERLCAYNPSIIVAPTQVLRQLALKVLSGELKVAPKRVISAAEVLEPQDRKIIAMAFPELHEIYQATEGFIASTCAHGILHLNEEYIHVEAEWLDAEHRRFVPIITDFSRLTQPIVRYRLNDVLIARREPCPCGRVTRALDGIDGRCDDLLMLPSRSGKSTAVFSDMLARALAQALPVQADYRLVQKSPCSLHLHAQAGHEKLQSVRAHVERALANLGIDISRLSWTLHEAVPPFNPIVKRRRIIREAEAG